MTADRRTSADAGPQHESANPLVSVGLPVYNGERYLCGAVDSILAQTYGDIELIISDNASTDGTEAICRAYAARDPRVRYHREEVNRGAVWNFNRVFELARGEFFMWQAFDDARRPECVARCVAELRARPDAGLCCTGIALMDEAGHAIPSERFTVGLRPVGRTPEARLRALARSTYWYDFYGLARASVLRQTRLCQPVWGFDVVLLFELCLAAPVVLAPDPLFQYRIFFQKAGTDAASTLGPGTGVGRIPLSWTEFSLAMLRVIRDAPLSNLQRVRLATQFLAEFVIGNPVVRGMLGRHDVQEAAGRAFRARNPRALARVMLFGVGALPPTLAWRAAGRARRIAAGVVRRAADSRHATV